MSDLASGDFVLLGSLSSSRAQLDLLEQLTSTSSPNSGT